MNSMNMKLLLIVALSGCVATDQVTWAQGKKNKPAGPSYTVFQLDDLDGAATNVIPRDINNIGEAVGQVGSSPDSYAAVYWTTNKNTGTSSLQFLADGASAESINDAGEIAGGQYEANGKVIGRYWQNHTDESPLRLVPLQGDDESAAFAINEQGVIVGWSQSGAERRPVVWRIVSEVALGPFELPNLLAIDPTADPDNAFGVATSLTDMDSAGIATVVGCFMLPNAEVTDAARWIITFDQDGALQAIPSVLAAGAYASHVNNSDTICGNIRDLAAVWSPEETLLDRLRDVTICRAQQINSDGLIVGWAEIVSPRYDSDRAVMWSNSSSEMIVLDNFLGKKSPLGYLQEATAVNDQNVIVGRALNGAFLAVPD